jgi:hypothetical protein
MLRKPYRKGDDRMDHTQDLIDFYMSMSRWRVMANSAIKRTASIFVIFFLPTVLYGAYLFFSFPISAKETIVLILLIFLSVSLYYSYKWQTKKYLIKKYGDRYSSIILRDWRLFKANEIPFLEAYRLDKLSEKIGDLGITLNQIDDLIQIVETESETEKSKRWIQISLFAIMLFPIWNEYVGFNFNIIVQTISNDSTANHIEQVSDHGLIAAIMLGLIAIVLARSIFFVRVLLEDTLLSKSTRLKKLANTLRKVKLRQYQSSQNKS